MDTYLCQSFVFVQIGLHLPAKVVKGCPEEKGEFHQCSVLHYPAQECLICIQDFRVMGISSLSTLLKLTQDTLSKLIALTLLPDKEEYLSSLFLSLKVLLLCVSRGNTSELLPYALLLKRELVMTWLPKHRGHIPFFTPWRKSKYRNKDKTSQWRHSSKKFFGPGKLLLVLFVCLVTWTKQSNEHITMCADYDIGLMLSVFLGWSRIWVLFSGVCTYIIIKMCLGHISGNFESFKTQEESQVLILSPWHHY